MSRKKIIAGNWKMYKTIEEAERFVEDLIPLVKKSKPHIYIAVPFTAISSVAKKVKGTNIVVGAQNMNDATEGAFTGEISAIMLKEANASFVVIGHSERRTIFNESNDFVNRKVTMALNTGLQPILCIGETLQDRESAKTNQVLQEQLEKCLKGVSPEEGRDLVIAYEPIWAIGTGKTATPEIAQETHSFCRKVLSNIWNKQVANDVVIQYGGSVSPNNIRSLITQKDIDGVLVGGASLTAESFSKIINYEE